MWHDKIKYVSENCNMSNIKFIIKLNLIQAPLEAALSLFILEGFLIFSNIFTNSKFEAYIIIVMLFLPFLVATVTCVFYSIIINVKIFNKIYECTLKIEVEEDIAYEKIDNIMKHTLGQIHCLGTACYILVAVGCAYFLNWLLKAHITTPNFKGSIILMSAVIGALWNILGYWGDNKIDWCLIFNKLGEITEKYKNIKFNYLIKHFFIDIIILIFSCFATVCIFVFLKDNYRTVTEINLLNYDLLSHTFFLLAFGFIVYKYITILYRLYYKVGIEKIYSSYCNILK